MSNLGSSRWRRLLHSLWSAAAVCLFAISGLLGYLSLMESVAVANGAEETLRVRVLDAQVIGKDPAGNPASPGWWGNRVALQLYSPERSRQFRVEVAPFLGSQWAAYLLRDRLLRNGEVEIYPDPRNPGAMHIRSASTGVAVLLPFLCAVMGVLCLASSLRYQTGPLLKAMTSSADQGVPVSPTAQGMQTSSALQGMQTASAPQGEGAMRGTAEPSLSPLAK